VKDGELFAFAGFMGRLERPKREMGQDVLDSDHYPEHGDRICSRPNARYPPSRQLRSVARSRNAECRNRVRTVEALRCPADAVLSGEHPDQSCGER